MLELINIRKQFAGTHALKDVTFSINKGEIHALCGENGAGKSTLMNIIAGNLRQDAGAIHIHGTPVSFSDRQDSQRRGISIVYQEKSLVQSLSVAENIFLNDYPLKKSGFIDHRALASKTRSVLGLLGLPDISPDTLVSDLSPARQQMVEIAKAVAKEPELLIMDEPTTALTEKETSTVFNLIRSLRDRGMSIIYISHRLDEVFALAQRVTVLKDGIYQGTFNISDVSHDALIRLMVGRSLGNYVATDHSTPDVILEARNLSGPRFGNINFQVRKGEIVALAGLSGAGRTEIARTIFGAYKNSGGSVLFEGTQVEITNTSQAVALGIGYVTEDRKDLGIFPDMDVLENMMVSDFAGSGFRRIKDREKVKASASNLAERLRIITPSLEKKMRFLSGGNQQKTVLARWLRIAPKLLIVDEPTQGVDVGAKFEIYGLLQELAKNGTSVLLISSELPEVLTIANRIVVIASGRKAGELTRQEASEEAILQLASSFKHQLP